MLTLTCHPSVSNQGRVSNQDRVSKQDSVTADARLAAASLPSDAEITRRVLEIRSHWSLAERVERRQEADNRFADLLDKLCVVEAA